jgi:5-methylcytosine-specific restriction endonuclease McrA
MPQSTPGPESGQPPRRCPHCRTEQAAGDFTAKARWCRECVREYNRRDYLTHRDVRLAKQRRYESTHRAAALVRVRTWRAGRPDARREEYRRYYATHRERERERRRAAWERNPEHFRERGRRSYRRNPERYKPAYHKRRALKLRNGGAYTLAEWRALCARGEHRCLCCGRAAPEIGLTPDHVLPLSRGGSNDIGNIQPLCLTCNLRKGTRATDYRPERGT